MGIRGLGEGRGVGQFLAEWFFPVREAKVVGLVGGERRGRWSELVSSLGNRMVIGNLNRKGVFWKKWKPVSV